MKRVSNAVLKEEAMQNPLIPTHCPSCNAPLVVDGIHLRCVNASCDEQNILLILHWVTNCGIEHFAESSVRALYDAGKIKTVKDLYKLTPKSFNGLDGFGSRKTENALSEIERTKEMTLASFIDKLSIDLVGEKAVAKLGIKTVDEFLGWSDTTFVVGKNIMEFVKENKKYINDLLEVVVIKAPVVAAINPNGRRVCFTGFRIHSDAEIKRFQENGDIEADGVNKNTKLLVVKDINSESSKTKKAKELGIEIQSYDQYFK